MTGGLNSYSGAAQASKAHVMRVKCNLLSNESRCHVTGDRCEV